MRTFNHIGLPTEEHQPGELFVPETKVWVTRPNHHPLRIEYLRYEPDSPVTGPLREQAHIAFQVDDLDSEIEGEEILLEPFEAVPGLHVTFILKDGAVWEFMRFDEGHQAEGFLPRG